MKNQERQKSFVGVILASIIGNELYPLTKSYPISNLPIGNKKLILYQLQQLEQIADMNSIVILYNQESIKVKQYLQSQFLPKHPKYPKKLQFFYIQDSLSEYSALQKLFASSLCDGFEETKGVFIIPPDVISTIKFNALLQDHIENEADLTVLLKQKKQYGKDQKKPDYECEPQVDIVLVNNKNQVFSLKSLENYQFAGFNLPASVYQRINRASFKKVIDTRVYIFGSRIIKIIKNLISSQLNQLKIDFVDTVIRNQSNSTLLQFITQKNKKPIKIFSRIAGQNDYIRRISNIKIYQNMNLDSLVRGQKQKDVLMPNVYTQPLDDKYMSEFKGSLIGKGNEIESNNKITRSIIERDCKIGKNVEMFNSVIMSGCTIEHGCKINNSIVGPKCHIKSQASLISCQLAMGCIVESGTNNQKQILIPIQ